MSLLVKAVLVALVTWLTFFDKYCTQFFTYRPIVIGPIIGLIMGDLKMGLMVGCTIELMFLGQVFVGTALPPEETFSTIIATAFACISGSTSEIWCSVYGLSTGWRPLLSGGAERGLP